jgi:hypothetical protein
MAQSLLHKQEKLRCKIWDLVTPRFLMGKNLLVYHPGIFHVAVPWATSFSLASQTRASTKPTERSWRVNHALQRCAMVTSMIVVNSPP